MPPLSGADPAMPLVAEGLVKVFKNTGPRTRRGARRKNADGTRQKRRRTHVAVDHISIQVEPGEIFGVLGANGSGKSTLVRILSTLLLPDAGEVRIFGIDAVRQAAAVRPLLNRVSADPSFFRAMSPEENLLFFGRAYGLSGPDVRRRSAEILERLSLDAERAREPMQHLSRGQQQKVAVARAFLTAPRLLLLDEPTTGLDPRSKREVQAFVSQVRREDQTTIMLTTHDMEEAEQLCDRIAFIVGGRIVAEGTPLQLRKQVADGRPLDEITMETVFMTLTGQDIEADEEEERARVGD